MDPRLLLILSAVFMLLNGGVLGLMHRGLPDDAQPAARDWRIGTLLMAGGSLLLAAQDLGHPLATLPLANGCVFAAAFLYWSAMRRFFGEPPPRALMTLPIFFGAAAVAWFSSIEPSFNARVVSASPVLIFYLTAAAWTMHAHRRRGDETSLGVLTGIFAVVAAFLTLRTVYHAFADTGTQTLLSAGLVINGITSILVAVLPVIGTTAFLVLVTERARRHAEHAAATDELTGLPNRRTLRTMAKQRFQSARAEGTPWRFAVAMLDVDHFKAVNDKHGHDVGDAALRHVAAQLQKLSREGDVPGRLGGEEFAVLLTINERDEARVAAERMRTALADTPLALGSATLTLTASFGVATMLAEDDSFDAMLKRADQALYRAKHGGRNRVEG